MKAVSRKMAEKLSTTKTPLKWITKQSNMAKEKKKKKPPPRTHQAHWKDNTITARSDKKIREWQMAAELNGFETWSGMMTYIKNQALQGKATVNKNNA